jgi:hypothetical protein
LLQQRAVEAAAHCDVQWATNTKTTLSSLVFSFQSFVAYTCCTAAVETTT